MHWAAAPLGQAPNRGLQGKAVPFEGGSPKMCLTSATDSRDVRVAQGVAILPQPH